MGSAFENIELYKKPNGVTTLYQRMGGEVPLEKVVDGVYHLMKADPEIGKPFARFRLERLKDRTVDYLRGEFGGPAYNGSDLWISHSHMGISDHWYDIMMKYYTQMLKKVKIEKGVAQEIYDAIEAMRRPIVDPGQKFKAIYMKKAEKEAKQAQIENDERERIRKAKEMERAAKMAELKKARELAAKQTESGSPIPSPMASMEVPGPKETKAKKSPAPSPMASMEVASPKEAKTKRPASAKPKKVDATKYHFDPLEDAPPTPLPSSAPSGAEQIYRFEFGPAARAIVSPAMGA